MSSEPVLADPFGIDRRERILVLAGTLGLVLLGIGLGFLLAPAATLELVGLVPISVFAAGKFLPLWALSQKSHFSPWHLGLVIWALDTITILIVVYALWPLLAFKKIRLWIDKVREEAKVVLEAYPKMRRYTVVGLTLFVLFPVAGTGAFVGGFVGILLGLPKKTLIASVSAGGFLGGMLIAALSASMQHALLAFHAAQEKPWIQYTILASVLLLIIAVMIFFNRMHRKALLSIQANKALADKQKEASA